MAEEERLENGRPERRARIRLLAKMTDPQGHVHETKHARAGICRMQDGGILLEYDEEQEGERAHVVLTAGSRQAAMRRRGGMSGTLRFVPASGQAAPMRRITAKFLWRFLRTASPWSARRRAENCGLSMICLSAGKKPRRPGWMSHGGCERKPARHGARSPAARRRTGLYALCAPRAAPC